MRPRSPIFDLLALSGEWEPIRSLAQDAGRNYVAARRSIDRWKSEGLVETRQVELGRNRGGWGEHDIKMEVRILEANQ